MACGDNNNKFGESERIWQIALNHRNLSKFYPERGIKVDGKFTGLIHISYKLSTVSRGLSTVLWKKQEKIY